jgi:hypothetical protein
MSEPHLEQIPKLISSLLRNEWLSLFNLFWASRSLFSLTLLLLIASIRLTRPMAFSGDMGLVNSLRPEISFSVFFISSEMRAIMKYFSSEVIDQS